MPLKLPELLAPAGSLEAFHAAIEAGADAIFLGTDRFNARLRAKNFSLKTLSYLVPYAHSRGVKLHVTLNTLVRQPELPQLFDTLQALEQIGPDALIVQDLGAAFVLSRYFPKLVKHASTQMAVHDSIGVDAMRRMGFSRVILARELTLDEMRKISAVSKVELEVFVHGAICYSISGLCLASSYLGGASGNRGQCTQVCRRRFTCGESGGFYFSPRDFSAMTRLREIVDAGIASLKIEGRMRSAEYVYDVVSSYRTALDNIDNPEIISAASEKLEKDFGREKTLFFLDGVDSAKGIVSAGKPSGTGIEIGRVASVNESGFSLDRVEEDLSIGDRIRFHSPDGEEGKAAKVTSVSANAKQSEVKLTDSSFVKHGDTVYIVNRRHEKRGLWEKAEISGTPVKFRERHRDAGRLIAAVGKAPSLTKSLKLPPGYILRIDDIGWLDIIDSQKFSRIIVRLSARDFDRFFSDSRLVRNRNRIVAALPYFIPEDDIEMWRGVIEKLESAGICEWMVSQIGHRLLFSRDAVVYADQSVWTINTAAQHTLADAGFSFFVNSFEDDYLNMKSAVSPDGILPIFAYVPLFISRVHFAVKHGSHVKDNRGQGFMVEASDGLYYTVGEQPYCLTHRLDKMREAGVRHFMIDLSFCSPDRNSLNEILAAADSGTKVPGTVMFNHKAGLR